mgnify:CR=1 FL=1
MKQWARLSFAVLMTFLVAMPVLAENTSASKNIIKLSNEICAIYRDDGTKIAKYVDSAIKVHLKEYEAISNPTPEQIIHFLNRNKNAMTCGKDNKNYMMVSFEHGRAYDQLFNVLFFDWLLSEDESQWVDINAVSFSGKPTGRGPETLLDFMDRVLEKETQDNGKVREMKSLIETFETYLGGKRFKDLSLSDQQYFLRNNTARPSSEKEFIHSLYLAFSGGDFLDKAATHSNHDAILNSINDFLIYSKGLASPTNDDVFNFLLDTRDITGRTGVNLWGDIASHSDFEEKEFYLLDDLLFFFFLNLTKHLLQKYEHTSHRFGYKFHDANSIY